jgi:hypothetical protein
MTDPLNDYWIEIPSKPQAHRYRLRGGPIDTPAEDAEVFLALGRAFAAWSRTEQHIDAIILQVNKANHSTPELDLFDPKHPVPFADKIKLLKRYFRRHPALAQFRDDIVDIADGLKAFAEQRNDWAHSILQEYDRDSKRITFNLIRYQHKTRDFLCREKVTPIQLVDAVANHCIAANKLLSSISSQLFTVEGAEMLRMPGWQERPWWRRLWDRLLH